MPDLELIRTMALPYWARPGIVTATDDENGGDDETDDEDDDLDDEEDDDEDADKTDEELRAELKEIRKRLSKANDSSKSKRIRARELQKQLDDARRQPAKKKVKDDEDDAPDLDAIRESARQEARAESDNRVKRASVRSELRAAGIPAESAGRLVGLVKLDDLDVDDDGNVDGLDDVIDELRADFPQLFGKGDDDAPKRTARRSVAGREGTSTGRSKKLSTDEAQAAALVRR